MQDAGNQRRKFRKENVIFENGKKNKFPETNKKISIENSWILARKTYENRRTSQNILDVP